jgi:hypothetical protein
MAILLLALILNPVLFAILGPSSVYGSPEGTLASFIGQLALLSIAAYQALAIQRALPVRLFRNQAGGMGLVAVGLIVLFVGRTTIAPFLPPGSSAPNGLLNYLLFDFTWLVLFYWIDASIRAARRSDPLLRDTLRWSRVRIGVWAMTVGAIVVSVGLDAYLVAATGLSLFAQPNLPIIMPLLLVVLFLPIIAGGIYLPIAAFRSRDPILRRHFVLFGYFILLLVAFFLLFFLLNSSVNASAVIFFAQSEMFLVACYLLYRSARSLAPLNRISLD